MYESPVSVTTASSESNSKMSLLSTDEANYLKYYSNTQFNEMVKNEHKT